MGWKSARDGAQVFDRDAEELLADNAEAPHALHICGIGKPLEFGQDLCGRCSLRVFASSLFTDKTAG